MKPSALPADHKVETHAELCLALGGDSTSFTGDLLRLIAKSDPVNRPRLRLAFPFQVAAWEIWTSWTHSADGKRGQVLTAGLLRALAESRSLLTPGRAISEVVNGPDGDSYVTRWACQQPEIGQPYRVLRDHWDADYSVRTIEQIELQEVQVHSDRVPRYPVAGLPDGSAYFQIRQSLEFDYYDKDGAYIRTEAAPPAGWSVTVDGPRISAPAQQAVNGGE